jgi:hypothetical protein
VKLLAWFETNCLARGDANLGTGAGVAANARLSGLDSEDAEAAEFDPIASDERLFHAFEDGIDGGFRLGPGKPGPFNDALDEILLDQERCLSRCGAGT